MKWYWWAIIGIGLVALTTGTVVAYSIQSEGEPYLDAIKAAAAQYGIPWELMAAEIWQESRFDPNAVSPAGAQGIAQFMPGTASQLGIDPLDPSQAIPAMAQYLAQIKSYLTGALGTDPGWDAVLAGYNWGMGAVKNAVEKYGADWLQYAPAETQGYVTNILGAVQGYV